MHIYKNVDDYQANQELKAARLKKKIIGDKEIRQLSENLVAANNQVEENQTLKNNLFLKMLGQWLGQIQKRKNPTL